ncbi:DNA polymerase III subunit gamma/tau [Candidatus Phycosocius spiralis]|uniref:DNA polymerase III subunit gamma/tau n=1 Tax=Candidatus Phycosocius spiralis TaxID=2815099 RepID=A0ABQ4PSF3_9PROT|nr:DNA polymerase III subunit gamma/tau [Candidatus Phycosocius spiralis]GIU65903.1 DNA polymerase III subunit gamma/tau [Candidatus Phycosocius spiralis]
MDEMDLLDRGEHPILGVHNAAMDAQSDPDMLTISIFDQEGALPIAPTQPYLVLARKYRPQRFEDLIGQEAMVRTLTHAFGANRIAHAFMLTGVRGVGKTTTARLIARALNYQSPSIDHPSMVLDPLGSQCEAITRGNHPDVFELDAASRTGVGDMRELLDGVRYGPIAARYKVYIIDEVHMLSKSAFNALLKTLEEPPPHVKFIFATTEIRQVPVTILSRCQRFDLRRIEPAILADYLERIAQKEGTMIARDGLDLIARAAEGSARDGLSLLDQAIVQDRGNGVSGADIRDMLGLADRSRTLDLIGSILKGDAKSALEQFREQFDIGADPSLILRDLMDLTHEITRAEVLGSDWHPAGASDQIARLRAFAQSTSPAALARLWQMLLRGFEEVTRAPDPVQAAEMCLLRLCAALSLPPPEDLARLLQGQSVSTPAAPVQSNASSALPHTPESAATAATNMAPDPVIEPIEVAAQVIAAFGPSSFEMALEMLEEAREIVLVTELERFVRLIGFKPGELVIELLPNAPADLLKRTAEALTALTQSQWRVELGKGGRESIVERTKRLAQERLDAATAAPEIQAALEAFPGARIVEIRPAPVPSAIQHETSPIDLDAMEVEVDEDSIAPDNVLSVDFTRKRVGD